MKWVFAKTDGGREGGFHDAGVETFKGNFDRYLARELIQNSLDARFDPNKPVHVKFQIEELKPSELPDCKGLKLTFDRCAQYWSHQKKTRLFFETAAELISARNIPVLRVGDYNTSGVVGSDENREENWYNLIRSAGSSSKTGNEGGSFGIGKNAPFAASKMRTVLYSTYNKEKEHVFQGVAMLVSHDLPNGTKLQPTGYLGGKGGASIRDTDEIPPSLLRSKMGTDIIVVGFPKEKNWQNDLVYSVLENFWPAIDLGDLEVTVGGENISSKNLGELLIRFSGQEDFTAHQYYRAFKESSYAFQEKLPTLREVSLYLSTGDNELPNKVAMVRKTGMVVFMKPFRSTVRFCGVFICGNETGNKLLREMEPPRHDTWDPDHPEKGENKKIESEYVHFIRDSVKTLTPTDDSKIISVPDLSRFLPDDDDSPEEEFGGDGDHQTHESADRRKLPDKIEGKKIDPRKSSSQPDHIEPGEGDEDAESGSDFTSTGDEGGGMGAGSNASGAGGKGGPKGEESKPSIPIRYRTFATNLGAGLYAVTVQSEQRSAKNATIAVWTVGDDQKAPAEIVSARLRDGKAVPVKATGVLGPLALPGSKGVLHLEVRLKEPMLLAMEVAAHEAE
jgi:hypothetical protein